MIVLGKKDIEELVDLQEMMDQIEEAYRIFGAGDYFMPPRPVVEHENKTMMYMPCYTKEIIGTKILSIFPENSKLGLPSIDGVVLLNDLTTGSPLAVMDGQCVKGLPHSGDRGRRGARVPPGALCLRREGHPYGVRVQPQWAGSDGISRKA